MKVLIKYFVNHAEEFSYALEIVEGRIHEVDLPVEEVHHLDEHHLTIEEVEV